MKNKINPNAEAFEEYTVEGIPTIKGCKVEEPKFICLCGESHYTLKQMNECTNCIEIFER